MLYDKVNYTAGISYLSNVFIYEYDISKANINVLFMKNVIDKHTYDYLYEAPRMVRQVYVGKLCRDTSISEILKAGIIEAKKMFFEANNIQDRDVLSIKNDAVFIIGKRVQYTEFGLIKFVAKNVYTSFYKLANMEFYYYYSNATKEEYLDIKGISDKNLQYHEGFFLQIIKDLFYSIQVNGPEISMRMLKDVYNEYISLQLPVECYRQFNTQSEYHFKFKCGTTGYGINNASEAHKQMLDITFNISILMEIQRILVSQYFNKYK